MVNSKACNNTLSVALPRDLVDKLYDKAEKDELYVSGIIRNIISDYFKNN